MNKLISACLITLGTLSICASCKEEKKPAVAPANLVESSSIVGIWQRMQPSEYVDEETGLTISTLTPRSRYKCIMSDGTYFLLDAKNDRNGELKTNIIHYGSYTLKGDTLEIEHIENCPTQPVLNGHDSFVRYELSDVNTLSLYYRFGVSDGSAGSSVWTPEIWKRVRLVQ